MAFILWSTDYSVGVEAFDADHIILISLLNHLHEARQQRKDGMVLGSILAALLNYVDTHFQREEALMKDAGYPAFGDHKEEHDQIARRIEDMQRRYKSDDGEELADELLELLKIWLVEHILDVDMRYKVFFQGLGA